MNQLAARIYGVTGSKATARAVDALKHANPALATLSELKAGTPLIVPVVPAAPATKIPELKAGSGAPPFVQTLARIRDQSQRASEERKSQAEALLKLSDSAKVRQLADEDPALAKMLARAVKKANLQQKAPPPLDDAGLDELKKATASLLGLPTK